MSQFQGDAALRAAALAARPGAFDQATGTWYLRSTINSGAPDAGQFSYGGPGWTPVVGDWNGDGTQTIGVVNPAAMTWHLRNSNSAGNPDLTPFQYGGPGWIPVVGDWDGNGTTTIGAVDPATMTWYLRNTNSAGAPDLAPFQYGGPGSLPVVGDWDGNGTTTIGAVNAVAMSWFLRNSNNGGAPDLTPFRYGGPGWQPLVGDWDGNGTATAGVVDPQMNWYLRNSNSSGNPDCPLFPFGGPTWKAVAGNFTPPASTTPAASTTGTRLITLTVNPLNIRLLGLEIQTDQIQVHVSAQPGQAKLLGNLLTAVGNLVNLPGVNNALNNVLGSVVTLLNSVSLNLNGINTTSGPFATSPTTATTPILDAFIAPVHLDLLGAVVDTSPIRLKITARSGPGLVLGNLLTSLANLFNPPLPDRLDLNFINARLRELLSQLNVQIPNIPAVPTTTPTLPQGTQQILSLTLPPINLNLLGLVLKTTQIQVNANAQTGTGALLGNVLTTLLNTLGATPQNLMDLSSNLNALLAKVVGVLNASSLVLSGDALGSLSQVLQTLALPNLVNATGTASAPILHLVIASSDGVSPPVDVNLLGVVVRTSNIQVQLLAQTGQGQILGNLLFNVANLLNPGGTLNLLTILNALGL